MHLEGIDSKVAKMEGDCFVTSLNAGNGLFQQKVPSGGYCRLHLQKHIHEFGRCTVDNFLAMFLKTLVLIGVATKCDSQCSIFSACGGDCRLHLKNV